MPKTFKYLKVPIFTEPSGPIYRREIATHDFMTATPMLEDPYERQMTEVRQSNVCGAGEGLFAKVDIEPNTVAAFYNGRRVRPRYVLLVHLQGKIYLRHRLLLLKLDK